MQNKNKVVPTWSWCQLEDNSKHKKESKFPHFHNFFTGFSVIPKNQNKRLLCFHNFFFCFFLDLHWFFKHTENQKTIGFFSQIFFFLELHLFFQTKNQNKGSCGFTNFFFSLFFLGILHWSFTHINNQNTVDIFCIILANCEAYTL